MQRHQRTAHHHAHRVRRSQHGQRDDGPGNRLRQAEHEQGREQLQADGAAQAVARQHQGHEYGAAQQHAEQVQRQRALQDAPLEDEPDAREQRGQRRGFLARGLARHGHGRDACATRDEQQRRGAIHSARARQARCRQRHGAERLQRHAGGHDETAVVPIGGVAHEERERHHGQELRQADQAQVQRIARHGVDLPAQRNGDDLVGEGRAHAGQQEMPERRRHRARCVDIGPGLGYSHETARERRARAPRPLFYFSAASIPASSAPSVTWSPTA